MYAGMTAVSVYYNASAYADSSGSSGSQIPRRTLYWRNQAVTWRNKYLTWR